LEEEALNLTVWRTGFVRSYGSVADSRHEWFCCSIYAHDSHM